MENTHSGKWFVVQTLSGQEFKVQESVMKRREFAGVADRVFDVAVPTERVSEVRQGRKTTMNRKFFPGYILVNMALYDADGQVDGEVWAFIKDSQGIIGFIGGDRPLPLTDSEVSDIMNQAKEADETDKPKIDFEIGEVVNIRDGAFENFEGEIESVDPDRGKLRLSVSIFGRSTPVEVEYWQVERAT